MMCNYIVRFYILPSDLLLMLIFLFYQGNSRWVEGLETQFFDEYSKAETKSWVIKETGKAAGEVRTAGGGGFTAGNVTFVNVYNAGYGPLFRPCSFPWLVF